MFRIRRICPLRVHLYWGFFLSQIQMKRLLHLLAFTSQHFLLQNILPFWKIRETSPGHYYPKMSKFLACRPGEFWKNVFWPPLWINLDKLTVSSNYILHDFTPAVLGTCLRTRIFFYLGVSGNKEEEIVKLQKMRKETIFLHLLRSTPSRFNSGRSKDIALKCNRTHMYCKWKMPHMPDTG